MSGTLAPFAPCPCGSGRPFGACCEPLLTGAREASNARELMRSRYTAHAVGDEAYLHRTYAPTAGKPYVPAKHPARRVAWTRLVIHGEEGGSTSEIAFVDFSAFFREAGREHEMRERSEFRRVGGRWLYTRAVPPAK